MYIIKRRGGIVLLFYQGFSVYLRKFDVLSHKLFSSVNKQIVSQIPLHQYLFLLHIIDDVIKFVRVL